MDYSGVGVPKRRSSRTGNFAPSPRGISREESPRLGTSRKRDRSESPVAARQVSDETIDVSVSGSGESGDDERQEDEMTPTRNERTMRKNAKQRTPAQNPLANDDSGRSSRRGRNRNLIDYSDRIYSKSAEPEKKSTKTRRSSAPLERNSGGKNLKSDEMSDQDTPPGSEIHPSKLKVSTRILILYKTATLYKGTILNRRFTDKGDEYLVHYDGNKKSNQKWVAGTNIRGLIEDESDDEDGRRATGSSTPQIGKSSAGTAKPTKVNSSNAKPVGKNVKSTENHAEPKRKGGVRPGAGRKYVNGKAVNTGHVPDGVPSSPSVRTARQTKSSAKNENIAKKKSPRLKKNNPECTDTDGTTSTLRRRRSPGRSSKELSGPDAVSNLSDGKEFDEDGTSAPPKKKRRLVQRRSHVEMLMSDEFKESTRRPTRSESVDFSREMALAKRSASQIKRRTDIDMLLADDAARRVSELSFSSMTKKDPSVPAKTKRKQKKRKGRPKLLSDGELPPLDEMPGSEVETAGLSEDSRVLVLYRGMSLYRATVHDRRRRLVADPGADEEDEFLVHYDGNKKTNLKWVRAILIRGLLDDDDDKLIQEKPKRRTSRATRAEPTANSPKKRSPGRPLKSDKVARKSPSSPRGITRCRSGKWQVQIFYAGKSRYIGGE